MSDRPEYITRGAMEDVLKAMGDSMGEHLATLSRRISDLESELALQRALKPARKEDA